MIWNTAKRVGTWLRPSGSTSDATDALTMRVEMPSHDGPPVDGPKVRKLRRRLLSRKGARMIVSMVENRDQGMLSVLDVYGVVVYWHDGAVARTEGPDHVLDRHVAQFYAPKKDSQAVADDHLTKAFAQGGSSDCGWRRRVDGSVFWGSTVIAPLLLADGRLQGFTHVTHAVSEPREPVLSAIQHGLKSRLKRVRPLRCVGVMAHSSTTLGGATMRRSARREPMQSCAAFG